MIFTKTSTCVLLGDTQEIFNLYTPAIMTLRLCPLGTRGKKELNMTIYGVLDDCHQMARVVMVTQGPTKQFEFFRVIH